MSNRYVDLNDAAGVLRWAEGISGNAASRFIHLVSVAEQVIDNSCGRTFGLDGAVSQRWYEVTWAGLEDGIEVDDTPHAEVTEVLLSGSHPDAATQGDQHTLTRDEWHAEPLARLRNGQEWPAESIRVVREAPVTSHWVSGLTHRFAPRAHGEYPYTQFPGRGGDVMGWLGVTAKWGWPAVPQPIIEATILLTNRLTARTDTPLGMSGGDEYGWSYVRKNDPDIADLLAPYRKLRLL